MVEARARFGRVVGLKTTKKGVWKGKQGQNGVVLACSFKRTETKQCCFCSKIKIKIGLLSTLYNLTPEKKKRKIRRKRRRRRRRRKRR